MFNLEEYLSQSCCTIQECDKWNQEECYACRRRMILERDNQMIEDIKAILQEHEGTFFWYEEVSKALDDMKEKKNDGNV